MKLYLVEKVTYNNALLEKTMSENPTPTRYVKLFFIRKCRQIYVAEMIGPTPQPRSVRSASLFAYFQSWWLHKDRNKL
jgi:hypothetical protein